MKLNGTVKWAKVFQPDENFNPKWCLDLYPDAAQLKKLKSMGFAIKTDGDGDEFVHIKRNVTTKKGKKNDPPRVVGANGKDSFTDLIGNGSIINVIASDYEYMKKKYLWLEALQVVNHVPYNQKDTFDDLTVSNDESEEELFSDESEY